ARIHQIDEPPPVERLPMRELPRDEVQRLALVRVLRRSEQLEPVRAHLHVPANSCAAARTASSASSDTSATQPAPIASRSSLSRNIVGRWFTSRIAAAAAASWRSAGSSATTITWSAHDSVASSA